MSGIDCPIHKTPTEFIATTNNFPFYCTVCDKRYSYDREAMPSMESLTRNDLFKRKK